MACRRVDLFGTWYMSTFDTGLMSIVDLCMNDILIAASLNESQWSNMAYRWRTNDVHGLIMADNGLTTWTTTMIEMRIGVHRQSMTSSMASAFMAVLFLQALAPAWRRLSSFLSARSIRSTSWRVHGMKASYIVLSIVLVIVTVDVDLYLSENDLYICLHLYLYKSRWLVLWILLMVHGIDDLVLSCMLYVDLYLFIFLLSTLIVKVATTGLLVPAGLFDRRSCQSMMYMETRMVFVQSIFFMSYRINADVDVVLVHGNFIYVGIPWYEMKEPGMAKKRLYGMSRYIDWLFYLHINLDLKIFWLEMAGMRREEEKIDGGNLPVESIFCVLWYICRRSSASHVRVN